METANYHPLYLHEYLFPDIKWGYSGILEIPLTTIVNNLLTRTSLKRVDYKESATIQYQTKTENDFFNKTTGFVLGLSLIIVKNIGLITYASKWPKRRWGNHVPHEIIDTVERMKRRGGHRVLHGIDDTVESMNRRI